MPEYLSDLNIKGLEFQIFIEESNGVYVAHALEAGIVASDVDRETALFKLHKLLLRHVEFAEKNDREDLLYHKSPADVWARFTEAKAKGTIILIESRIRFISIDNRAKVRLNQKTYAREAA